MRMLLLLLLLTSHVLARDEQEASEQTQDAMELCNKKCSCDDEKKTIKCTRMKHFWALATEGDKFGDEFAGFFAAVSDNFIIKIDRTFVCKSGHCNGLAKIKSLTLSSFQKLQVIQPLFFQKYFPNLEYLTITESENQLREVVIGRLPRLRVLQVNGANIKKVTGCSEQHPFCFREDRMELVQVPTLNLRRMGLPDFITEVKIDRNNASMEYGDVDVFRDKRVNQLKYIISKMMPFPPVLYDIEVMDQFYFEIPSIDDELQLWAMMVTLQEQPSLVSRMSLKMKTDKDMDMKFPVIMKSCDDCDFEKIARVAEFDGACFEEQNYLDTFNVDLPLGFQKNRYLTIRGIYVDVESLLETLDGDSTFHVTVYAFVAKVPKTKLVNFDLKVYYAVLQNNVAELSQVLRLRKPYTTIRYEDTFGASIHYAKKVDALFVHAYSLCIAKLTAKFAKDSPDDNFIDSVPWRMFSNLPNIAIYSSCNEVLTNSRISAIQGLLNKHTYMFVNYEKTVKILPYLYKDTQEELAEVLIESADMISKRKSEFQARKTPAQIVTSNLFHIKETLDSEDIKQMDFLEMEKDKVIALANIAWRRKVVQQAQLENLKKIIEEEVSIFADVENELREKAKTFMDGAASRNAAGWENVICQLTGALISSINMSKFDYESVSKKAYLKGDKLTKKLSEITALAQEMQLVMKEMETISSTYSNVKEIFQIKYRLLKRNLNEINSDGKEKNRLSGLVKRISKGLAHIEDVIESVTILYQSKNPSVTYSYESEVGSLATEGLSIVKRQSKINANDIMKWDLIRTKIKSLLDEDVILGIPESGEYLALLFNMIKKAKAIAQLKLDQSNLMSDVVLSDKGYWEYIEEAAALSKAVDDISKAKLARSQDTSIEKLKEEYKGHYMKTERYIFFVTFINKLRIIDAHKEFCQGYYYHYLHKCPDEYNIDIYTPLPDVMSKYEGLVLDNSFRTPQYFEAPPQPFDDFGIVIKKEDNCKCVAVPYEGLKGIDNNRNVTDEEKDKFKSASKTACFPHSGANVPVRKVFNKLLRCNMALVDTLIKHNSMSIEVPVNYKEDFTNYERVRIDDIKVVVEGIKTANGKVALTITNAGINQDRYHGDVFNFYGLPRVRKYEYCGKHIQKSGEDSEDVLTDLPPECQYSNHKTIVSTSTYEEFRGLDIKPTLFSTWVVQIPEAANKGLDLSEVTSLEILFSGSLLSGTTDYSKLNMTEKLVHNAQNDVEKSRNIFVKEKEKVKAYTEKSESSPLDEDEYHIYELNK